VNVARVIFFGTPALSVPTLTALHAAGHEIVLVVSQADKRRGRSSKVSPSPVKVAALDLGLPVTSRVKDVLDVPADIGVLVAFGRIIRPEILNALTIVNLHPSLLPRWRGATPVEAAILAGDSTTGICLMQLAEEMDAGPLYRTAMTNIEPGEKAADLYDRLFATGNEMLVQLLQGPMPEPVAQEGVPTYCGKFTAEDFRIDWRKPASHIEALTRIGRPWTTFRNKRVILNEVSLSSAVSPGVPGQIDGLDVHTGDGALTLQTVQPEGKPAMDAKAWLNGVRVAQDEKFE
jgi:methionyl-tRNA formyltransferase